MNANKIREAADVLDAAWPKLITTDHCEDVRAMGYRARHHAAIFRRVAGECEARGGLTQEAEALAELVNGASDWADGGRGWAWAVQADTEGSDMLAQWPVGGL